MWTLADAIARFLLAYIIPKQYADRIKSNVEPTPTFILSTQSIVRDKPRMTLIEGVFATLLFDLALFGTDNIFIRGIIRTFTRIQNGWDKRFRSPHEAELQIGQFCEALTIQSDPWIWEKSIVEYDCLNDFFSRRYAPEFMPSLGDADVVAPACCTMQLFESDEGLRRVLIKGCEYSLERIGLPSADIDAYSTNHVLLGYLSPTDYHRVHSPIAGRCVHCRLEGPDSLSSSVKFFGGRFNILNENTRLVVVVEAEGSAGDQPPMRVAVVVVGGVGVNTIVYDQNMEGNVIPKGDEIATFRAGGSAFAMFSNRPLRLTNEYEKAARGSRVVRVDVGESLANF